MKSYLIIPMGGRGKRFVNAGYKTYKAFLPIHKNISIFQKIISNFDKNFEIILLGNFKKIKNKINNIPKKKNIHLINIQSHNKGPLYSLYLGKDNINKIIKDNKNIFISYTDINWIWNIKKVLNFVRTKKIVVFTHKDFHPHLEVNAKSDFCRVKKRRVFDIREKKTFSQDYKKDELAIGCYFIKDLSYFNKFFNNNKNLFNKKKEAYFLTFIKYFLNLKAKVNNFLVHHFVHLGTPEQYNDFLSWQIHFNKKLVNRKIFRKDTCIMLMGGKGRRVSRLKKPKPFLLVRNKEIYKYIFDHYGSRRKFVITNKNFNNTIQKKNKTFLIKKTNSMFESVFASKKILLDSKNYILTSCDCFGEFNFSNFKRIKNKSDLILFGFKFSNMQKDLGNSHTQLKIIKNKVIDIDVKKRFKDFRYGHAGFFWIKNGYIFNYLKKFKDSKIFKRIKREVLIDDYFKFLIKNKLAKISYYLLDNYIHIGSEKEYQEYLYWQKYFLKNEHKYS